MRISTPHRYISTLGSRMPERSCRTRRYEIQIQQGWGISAHESAQSAAQSPDGQYRDRSGQYVGNESTLANGGQYIAQRRRAFMSHAAEYQTAQSLGADRGDIPGVWTC